MLSEEVVEVESFLFRLKNPMSDSLDLNELLFKSKNFGNFLGILKEIFGA